MSIEVHVRLRPGVPSPIWSSAETVLYSTVNPNTRYVYNKVHPPSSTNHNIFQALEPIVHAAFDGKNVTIMAYGQTGSGKTYSMIGTPNDAGVVPRTARLLLDLRATVPDVRLFAYYTEIYNESVKDLLDPQRGELALHDAADGGVYFDKRTVELRSMDEFLALHALAERNRKYGVTNLNDHSSRSHIVLSLEVHRGAHLRSVLNLVDLAGSESAARAATEGGALREGGCINRSLLALGNVVDAIVDKRAYVPYRDAKLTRLLRSCLGGSGITFILCCVNPSRDNFDQTTATLRFTQRAMKITKDPVVVLALPPLFVHQYARAVRQLRDGAAAACAAAYERGIRDTYTYAISTATSVVGAVQGHVHDALQALTSTQRLLVAHDAACAAAQLASVQRQLDEAAQQRAHAEARAASERKRLERSDAEVVERRAKLARLEDEARVQSAAADATVAEWEYALHEAKQRHVRDEELLLHSEQCARAKLTVDEALALERILSHSVPVMQSLLASGMRSLVSSSSSSSVQMSATTLQQQQQHDSGKEDGKVTTRSTAPSYDANNSDNEGGEAAAAAMDGDAAAAARRTQSTRVPATEQGLQELHRRLTRAQAELADLETAHAMVRDDLAIAAQLDAQAATATTTTTTATTAATTTATSHDGEEDKGGNTAAAVRNEQDGGDNVVADERRDDAEVRRARRAAHAAMLRALRDSVAPHTDTAVNNNNNKHRDDNVAAAVAPVQRGASGSLSPALMTAQHKPPQLRAREAAGSNNNNTPQQQPQQHQPSSAAEAQTPLSPHDRYALGVRNALSVLDQLRCRLMQNKRHDDAGSHDNDDDNSVVATAAAAAVTTRRAHSRRCAHRSRSRTPTPSARANNNNNNNNNNIGDSNAKRSTSRTRSRKGRDALPSPSPPLSRQHHATRHHNDNDNGVDDDGENVTLLEMYRQRQQRRPATARRGDNDDDNADADKENSTAAAAAAMQWSHQHQQPLSHRVGSIAHSMQTTKSSQSRARSKASRAADVSEDVFFATRTTTTRMSSSNSSAAASTATRLCRVAQQQQQQQHLPTATTPPNAVVVERALWQLHANSPSPSLSRDGRSRSRRT